MKTISDYVMDALASEKELEWGTAADNWQQAADECITPSSKECYLSCVRYCKLKLEAQND
jgi:hypothetical protein